MNSKDGYSRLLRGLLQSHLAANSYEALFDASAVTKLFELLQDAFEQHEIAVRVIRQASQEVSARQAAQDRETVRLELRKRACQKVRC